MVVGIGRVGYRPVYEYRHRDDGTLLRLAGGLTLTMAGASV